MRRRTSKTSTWKMCPPCVGENYFPNRACTAHGTCSRDHRARTAPATSRRTRRRPSRGGGAPTRTTNGKRTNYLDAPGNDTNGNNRIPPPVEKRTPTGRNSPFGEFGEIHFTKKKSSKHVAENVYSRFPRFGKVGAPDTRSFSKHSNPGRKYLVGKSSHPGRKITF